jgi:hypothetical protein
MGRGPVGAPAIIKYVNNSLASVDDVSNTDGAMILIKTLTASSSATLSFVNGTSDVVLDSTYPIYKFVFNNIHPETDQKKFMFQGTTNGSDFNTTMTTTWFQAYHNEGDGNVSLSYIAGEDQAQGTSFQSLCEDLGNDNDQCFSGELWLFNPSSTTFVKHFMTTSNETYYSDFSNNHYVAGYFNTTSAITGLQFKMESGNVDAGTIKLYGIA